MINSLLFFSLIVIAFARPKLLLECTAVRDFLLLLDSSTTIVIFGMRLHSFFFR